jgi:IS30 family transposase
MIKKYTQLNSKERWHIELLLQEDYGNNDIALRLGRSKSTISREIQRNKDSENNYSADRACEVASSRCKRILPDKFTAPAKSIIRKKLEIGDSP